MITEADRSKYALPPKAAGKQTIVDRADEEVDIRDIMRAMGLWAPSGGFSSWKIYCPFHEEHADQMDKNCRVYGTNNIYCFAMHGRLTPTLLYSRWKGMSRTRAAEVLLEERGLLHKSWRSWWNELLIMREDKMNSRLGAQNDAVAALHKRLELHVVYLNHEFDAPVRAAWQTALKALDLLWEHPETTFDVLAVWADKSLTKILTSAKLCEETNE